MNRLTPLEIQRATFARRWRGLDPDAIRDFLGEIAEQLEEEARTRGELRAQVARLTQEVEEYRQRAAAVNEALVAAQRTAEATITRAETEAQRIIADAEVLADRVVDDAAKRAENIELVISQLRTRRRTARADLKRLVEVLGGSIRDDEASEQRESEGPTVSFLRRRPTDAKGER
ncbi:MAG TPA: DivIVA domain-containing protein [Thermoanaerobaculaceae bacterium]|nr:DivIVA domain-containing protein [Thermoanaerobaculaceae bacterium]